MTNSQRLATVRARLLRWLSDLNPNSGSSSTSSNPIVSESILVRDGFYCGRRFHLKDHRAVWFLEEDELKIYANDGSLQCVLGSSEISQVDSPALTSPPAPPELVTDDQADHSQQIGPEETDETEDESGQVISIQIQPQDPPSTIRRAA